MKNKPNKIVISGAVLSILLSTTLPLTQIAADTEGAQKKTVFSKTNHLDEISPQANHLDLSSFPFVLTEEERSIVLQNMLDLKFGILSEIKRLNSLSVDQSNLYTSYINDLHQFHLNQVSSSLQLGPIVESYAIYIARLETAKKNLFEMNRSNIKMSELSKKKSGIETIVLSNVSEGPQREAMLKVIEIEYERLLRSANNTSSPEKITDYLSVFDKNPRDFLNNYKKNLERTPVSDSIAEEHEITVERLKLDYFIDDIKALLTSKKYGLDEKLQASFLVTLDDDITKLINDTPTETSFESAKATVETFKNKWNDIITHNFSKDWNASQNKIVDDKNHDIQQALDSSVPLSKDAKKLFKSLLDMYVKEHHDAIEDSMDFESIESTTQKAVQKLDQVTRMIDFAAREKFKITKKIYIDQDKEAKVEIENLIEDSTLSSHIKDEVKSLLKQKDFEKNIKDLHYTDFLNGAYIILQNQEEYLKNIVDKYNLKKPIINISEEKKVTLLENLRNIEISMMKYFNNLSEKRTEFKTKEMAKFLLKIKEIKSEIGKVNTEKDYNSLEQSIVKHFIPIAIYLDDLSRLDEGRIKLEAIESNIYNEHLRNLDVNDKVASAPEKTIDSSSNVDNTISPVVDKLPVGDNLPVGEKVPVVEKNIDPIVPITKPVVDTENIDTPELDTKQNIPTVVPEDTIHVVSSSEAPIPEEADDISLADIDDSLDAIIDDVSIKTLLPTVDSSPAQDSDVRENNTILSKADISPSDILSSDIITVESGENKSDDLLYNSKSKVDLIQIDSLEQMSIDPTILKKATMSVTPSQKSLENTSMDNQVQTLPKTGIASSFNFLTLVSMTLGLIFYRIGTKPKQQK